MKRTSPAGIGAVSSGTLMAAASIAVMGCSAFGPRVDPVGSGRGFSEWQVPRDTEYISTGTPSQKQYHVFNDYQKQPRVFNDDTRPLRAEAEKVARVFCERKGREINLLEISTFSPEGEPWFVAALSVLCACPGGPTAAVEVFFECLDKPNASGSPPQSDAR